MEREIHMATVIGTNAGEIIDGEDGVTNFDDAIYGLQGKDFIFGLGGNDYIDGGSGRDRLFGGEGSDTFAFASQSGRDKILDFNVEKDTIEILRGTNGIFRPKDVINHAKQLNNGDVVIDLGRNAKIILKNVDISDLKKKPGDHFDIV